MCFLSYWIWVSLTQWFPVCNSRLCLPASPGNLEREILGPPRRLTVSETLCQGPAVSQQPFPSTSYMIYLENYWPKLAVAHGVAASSWPSRTNLQLNLSCPTSQVHSCQSLQSPWTLTFQLLLPFPFCGEDGCLESKCLVLQLIYHRLRQVLSAWL